jgi:hypothetical protein
MGRIRPMTEADVPILADLHRRVFESAPVMSAGLQETYERYFTDVYLRNPWRNDQLPSLIFELDGGDVAGFVGVVPRELLCGKTPVLAAVATQFIVDPRARAQMAALHLLKRLFEGPQDLTLADEANDESRAVWEGLGGTTSLLYSVHWTRPLQPARLGAQFLGASRRLRLLALAATPITMAIDALLSRITHSQFHIPRPELHGEDASVDVLLECMGQVEPKRLLRPQYSAASLGWVLRRLQAKHGFGQLKAVAVRDQKAALVGCYIYYAHRGQMGEVLHVGAKAKFVQQVFAHLAYDARQSGTIALTGRLEPDLLRSLSDAYCLFQRGRHWALIHSRQTELLSILQRGDALFSRLDGEFCLRVR